MTPLRTSSFAGQVRPAAVGKAFAEFLREVPAAKRAGAARACARYLQRARLLHRAPEILDAVDRALLKGEGRTRADMLSADDLDARSVAHVEHLLAGIVDRPVEARVRVHPRLLAGFRAEADGLVADASLRGALSRLRYRLRSSRFA